MFLPRSLYAATGKTGVHTRRVGLDRDTNKELLLKHIRQNNEVGTPFKELQQVLPGLNRNQIQVLMRELKEDGKWSAKVKPVLRDGLSSSDSPAISDVFLCSTCD